MPRAHVILADDLRRFAEAVFVRAGVNPSEAAQVAESLVLANLCGHDSHGVLRLPEYIGQIRSGELVPGVEPQLLAQSAGTLIADGRLGFGQVQMRWLIGRLLPKAREQGAACGTLRNCGHVGRLGEWVELVAREQLAGLLTVNDNGVLTCVAPPGGLEPVISTNPIALSVPTGEGPLVLDMSTSVVANGKIRVALAAGDQCPDGWLQDAAGNPTRDPAVRFQDPPGTILPLGGADSMKGFGLGLLLDILTGGLSGGNCPPAPSGAPSANNVLMIVLDPDRFAGRPHLLAQADGLIRFIRRSRRKPGVAALHLPGDRSRQTHQQRSRTGIPLEGGTWQALAALADELHVPIPNPDRESDEP